jgi:thermopsin
MTLSQFSSFNDSRTDVSNSVYDQNGTQSERSFRVDAGGRYYLVFYAYDATANVTYSIHLYPNNPFQYGQPSPPQPTGIVSYGLYNDSNRIMTYDISTSRLAGVANITSLLAYNATAARTNSSLSGATLQLNSLLVLTDKSGNQQVFWCQNVPDFVTNDSHVSYANNVWNFTDNRYFLSNSSITSSSGGSVASFDNHGTTQFVYGSATLNYTYQLPLGLILFMNESTIQGTGVVLQMGVQMFRNGSLPVSPINWFDNITIHDPLVQSARFFTSGNDSTPTGYFYDTELVFGGEGNGESTFFKSLNASLGLFYLNGTKFVAFPSLYSFGGDTLEAADNLHVTYSGSGYPQVSTGTPEYRYLGRVSGSISFPTAAATVPEFNTPQGLIIALVVAIAVAAYLTRVRTGAG